MKALKLVPLFLIAFLFCNSTVVAQEEEDDEIIEEVEVVEVSTITGVYTGMEDGMFVFTYKDEDGEESTIGFDKITPEAKQSFDLNKKEMIGKSFVLTFSNVNEEEQGADGDIEYTSVKTILTLKKS
jgi:hypothetical protein